MDKEFAADRSGLVHALSLLTDLRQNGDVVFELPDVFPEVGIGARATLEICWRHQCSEGPVAWTRRPRSRTWTPHALVDLGHGALELLAEPEPSSSRHCARCAAHRREGNRLARAVLRDAGWSYDAGLNDGESYSALVSARVRGSGGSRHFGQCAPVDCKGCPSARVTLAGLNFVFAAADCRSRDGDGRPPGSTHGSTGYS